MYEERTYRGVVEPAGLVSFSVLVKETDLLVLAEKDLGAPAREAVLRYRHHLEGYTQRHPEFLRSLVPLKPAPGAPEIVLRMTDAGAKAGVGPMAAVAGAIAELVGEALSASSRQVIVENGGDIYIRSDVRRVVAVYAGDSPLSGKVGIAVPPERTPAGVCTSSGKVGHSLSLGLSHAACIVSRSASLADAAATAVGNVVKTNADIEKALDFGMGIDGVEGVLVIAGDRLGARGELELVKL